MTPLKFYPFQITSGDGARIICIRWSNCNPPRGVLQIAHGMSEHMGRYLSVIETLAHAGFAVYANDHRGHGRSAAFPTRLGDFGPGGFDSLVEDMVALSTVAREENPGLPFLLLGHGMGSFAAQQYVLDHSTDIDGLILSGSGALDGLAHLVQSGPPYESILNEAFAPARTPFDWLSRDPAVVDEFIRDPLCFGCLQPSSMESFLAASSQLADRSRLRGIRPDLPMYIFAGSQDPVGQQLEGVRTLMERYQNAGLLGVSHHFYLEGRHEMLNEINRDEVIADLLRWISKILNW